MPSQAWLTSAVDRVSVGARAWRDCVRCSFDVLAGQSASKCDMERGHSDGPYCVDARRSVRSAKFWHSANAFGWLA
jgi:hypothetical protein